VHPSPQSLVIGKLSVVHVGRSGAIMLLLGPSPVRRTGNDIRVVVLIGVALMLTLLRAVQPHATG